MPPRIVELRQSILKANDLRARRLREAFARAGTYVVTLVSSPGSGKTTLLCATLREMRGPYRAAALVGDLATDHDAARVRASGAPVRQITTGTVCHLDAEMVERAVAPWDLAALDILFIENVGNLVCPASYDLGEDLRAVLLSVTEGEDKPQKYPAIFHSADLAIITKMDLAQAAEYDAALGRRCLEEVRPDLEIFQVSAKSGAGMEDWVRRLETGLLGKRRHPSDPLRTAQAGDISRRVG